MLQIDFEHLLASSPNPYVLLDADLRIRWMNEAYLKVTARSREDILDRPMFEAFPSAPDSDSFKRLSTSFDRVLESGEVDDIALIRYDIPMPDGGMDVRHWTATHTPLKDESGKVAYILQHTVDVTELHGLRTLRDQATLMQHASAVETRAQWLAGEMQQMRQLFEQAPGFVTILSGPGHHALLANQAYGKLVGRNIAGKNVADALPEMVEQGFIDLLDTVYRTGVPYMGKRVRVSIEAPDAGESEIRYLNFIYQPYYDKDAVAGIFVQGYDLTEEVLAEERQKLLIDELNHRVKNMLAIVQGLALQSFKGFEGADEARAIFNQRLNALAAAHNQLTSNAWESAPVRDTIRNSVEATAGADVGRLSLDGPDVTLDPEATVSLTMIVHELTTNAIKYGALSVPAGKVGVRWWIEEQEAGREPVLAIEWRETGGPETSPPTRRGFGSRLIESGASARSSEKARIEYRPEGLVCTIYFSGELGEL